MTDSSEDRSRARVLTRALGTAVRMPLAAASPFAALRTGSTTSAPACVRRLLAGAGAQLCAELRARPAGEPPAVALRRALEPFIQFTVDQPDKTLRVSRLILDTPALLARFLERQSHWQDDIAAILAEHASLAPGTDLRPTLAAGVALTAFRVALRHWADGDGATDLGKLVDQAFAVVTSALDPTTVTC